MNIPRTLAIALIAAAVIGACVPVERDYGNLAPLDESSVPLPRLHSLSNDESAPAAALPPSFTATCSCDSLTCNGAPFVSAESDCGAVIGGSDLGGVQVRMAPGQLFMVSQGDIKTLVIGQPAGSEYPRSAFEHGLTAPYFAVGETKLFTQNFEFGEQWDTYRVKPNGSVVIATLPTSARFVGRTFTLQLVDSFGGWVDVHASENEAGSDWETIDGQPAYQLIGNYSSVQFRSSGSDWIVVSRYP